MSQSGADYRIVPDGTAVVHLSERSIRRASGSGPGVKLGWSMVFKSRYDTAEFVHAGEADGYIFEGKEYLVGAL